VTPTDDRPSRSSTCEAGSVEHDGYPRKVSNATRRSFRGLFVGIDRYASSAISWLSCAERDATALHALFADTFGDGGELLTSEQATRAAILAQLEALKGCSENDFVVIAFSGHGSELHQLVTYDAEITNLAGTTIPLAELADHFAEIPARRLVCVLDCCFSGGMGAKVLRVDAQPRGLKSTDVLLEELAGEGRLILTASRSTEEAWENGQVGHGLLTYHLVEALKGAEEVRSAGKISVLSLLQHVTRSVIDAAHEIGATQNPSLRGTIDGEFVWPVFTPGAQYYAAFPEKLHPPAAAEIASLAAFGFSEPVLAAWSAAIPKLNQLQLAAINEFGVLDSADLVVSAPTSSGKTMIGELAALKGIGEHRRALFLLPLKALVNDKHQEFERKYGPLGLRTIRATGEFNDDIPDLMQGHYDVALMTYEKATALLLANPHLLRQVGTIVIDEVQTVVDESRGANLEFLLTFLKVRRRQGIVPQMVALSAVIGDTNGLERWFGGRLLRREERPVPLREGVLTHGGAFRFLAPDGREQQEPLISVGYGSGSSQDWVIPLLAKLTDEDKKVIVFRETKGETTGCAAYLARTLGLPLADAAIAELPAADPSTASSALRQVMYGGVAFHNADLDREEKLVIERHFRDPASPLKVIVATTTLAMGVNTPASAVVIVGLTHPGAVPYSVAEYKNMIGRAGRLGFNEEGESYIVPPNPPESHAWAAYVLGQPEDLQSRFLAAGTDPRSLTLRVLASAGEAGLQREDIISFLEESFGAFQERARREGWEWDEGAVRAALAELETHELVAAADDGSYHPTELGRLAGESGIEVESMVRLVAALRPLAASQLNDAALVTAAQLTVELYEVLFPLNKKSTRKEPFHWPNLLSRWAPLQLVRSLALRASDRFTVTLRAKRATACLMWMSTQPRTAIERAVIQFGGARTAAGPIQSVASRTCDVLPVVARTAEILHPGTDLGEQTAELLVCLEIGLPKELAQLALAGGRALNRGEYLQLLAAGVATPEAVRDAEDEAIELVLGSAARVTQFRRDVNVCLEREGDRAALAALLAEVDANAA
jgi:helicase